ncbi:MAG TPA: GAF domain-containing protein [Polyangia bacterium]|jgi:adenylate cyclase|nr:GAF domain-containing protein [Polyangia bacterium]
MEKKSGQGETAALGSSPPATEEDVIGQLVGHRLRQDDIRRLLQSLSVRDREAFTEKLADLLRKTSALLEVSKRLADSLSLDVLLPRMVELVSDFLDAERCTIFLYDKETDELYTKAAVGLNTTVRFPSGHGIAGSVFKSGRSVHIPDAYADPRFNPEIDKKTGFHTRDILCAPIKHIRDGRTEVVGVAQVLNKRGRGFTTEDLTLLETLTSQAASAFVNAQLYLEIARARQEETQLLEVTAAMSTELQLAPLLTKIMETVCTILEADRATLFLYDARTQELWALVRQIDGVREIRFPCHIGIAGTVFTSGKTVNIPDAYADPRFNQEVDKKTGYRTNNILCMPVINRKGQTIAVTQVLNKRGGPFTAIDEKRLRAFSAQAAIAMENAQLFDEVNRIKNYNESILQSMSNGVITVDEAGTIIKVNAAACRLLRKKEPGEVEGQNVHNFFAGPNAWITEAVEAVQRTGQPKVTVGADLLLIDDPVSMNDSWQARMASVNLSVVPLGSEGAGEAKKQLGCMLMIEDITNEKRLRSTMSRYMSPEVAEKLLSEGEAALGGKMQKCSVLFTDIRSFTTISERLGPQETVKLLNEYFTLMVDIILDKGGILDKYIGDAIMAVFGAPFSSPEDADHAVQAAIEMLKALRAFNRQRLAEGQEPVLMGLGINSDDVLSGNIGSLKRMDYTVIGDGVNLASRLEGANKYYGTQILISEFTVRELKGHYRLREVDKIQVKGKHLPVGVYEVLDYLDDSSASSLGRMLDIYGTALERYRHREWMAARELFHQALVLRPEDGPSKLYLERCFYFLEHPPAADWDGVWVMKDK